MKQEASNVELLNKCVNIIQNKVSIKKSKIINLPIYIQEIDDTIFSMASGKSLGADGLVVEFYKKKREWIFEELLLVYKEDFEFGDLGEHINKVLLNLFPKVVIYCRLKIGDPLFT